ncbi:hypothetical protein [Bradyrhizobium sp. P5_C11_2]
MDDNDLDREVRRQRKLERIGGNYNACPGCGHSDWRTLEEHHYFNRRFGAETVWLCANCHRIITDDQKDHPMPISTADPLFQRMGHFMLNLAAFLRVVIVHLEEFGRELIRCAGLDANREGGRS